METNPTGCACGYDNDGDRYFCAKCGAFLKTGEISDKSIISESDWNMRRITSNLANVPHKEIYWDKRIDVCVKKIERLKALMKISTHDEAIYKKLFAEINDFLIKCANPEFQIAFVGTIKTGKSTLINSLLGHNYASMAVTPETAALTKFRKSTGSDYVNVTFYNSNEWSELWRSRTSGADAFNKEYKELNGDAYKDKWIGHEPIHREMGNSEIEAELAKWSSSKSPEHYFVKEIEVGISTLSSDFPTQVVFVDTPGLSDPVAYRSEITKNYIRKANAVFVCVDAQKIYKEEIETIASVFSFSAHNKNKVHIIATHWDTMNEPNEDWVSKQKPFMIKHLVGPGFFETEENARENIMHSAAYIYNLCRDYKTLEKREKNSLLSFAVKLDYDISELSEKIDEIMEKTNIDNIKSVIREKLTGKFHDLLVQDLFKQYNEITGQLKRYVITSRNDNKKVIEAANSNLDEFKKKIDEAQKNYKAVQNQKKMLEDALKSVNSHTQKRLEKILISLEKR